MSYESPITIYDFASEMSEKLTEEKDKYIYQQIRTYVYVDKEELIKALQYDRNQYDKGYKDGLEDAVVHGHWIRYTDSYDGYNGFQCSSCKRVDWELMEYDYCPMCGAKMDENGGE